MSDAPQLEQLLGALHATQDVCFALNASLRLCYRNPAWDRFALQNGAPELARDSVLGIDLRKVIIPALLPFYDSAFENVARDGTTREFLYECSSPDFFRKFRMQIQALAPSGFLVRNNLVMQYPHPLSKSAPRYGYVNAHSLIVVCAHCGCSQRASEPDHWDFVPDHLALRLTNISHGLCAVCLEYFYPKPGARRVH